MTASWHPSLWAAIASALISVWVLHHIGVTWSELRQAVTVPAAAVVVGALPVAVSLTPMSGLCFEISGSGLVSMLSLAARGVAAMLATLVFAFSTPVSDLAWLLCRSRVPRPLVDTLITMHRFLFALHGALRTLHQAQRARLGFIGWSGCIRSSGLIAGALFGRAIDQTKNLERGLAARGGLPAPDGSWSRVPRALQQAFAFLGLVALLAAVGGRA